MPKRGNRLLSKKQFLITNLIKGFVYLAVLIILFLLIKKYFRIDYYSLLEPTFEHPLLVYLTFSISELAFGIIPPELFFIWASALGSVPKYIFHVALLSIVSYLAGINGFFIGGVLKDTSFYSKIEKRFLSKYKPLLRLYGTFAVIVAAITPLPFSGISILVGTTGFGWKKYALAALFRFLRFALYAVIMWEADHI
ncbi:MAG: hypothetical protein AAF363_16730 [Bacteroidota bacterium]